MSCGTGRTELVGDQHFGILYALLNLNTWEMYIGKSWVLNRHGKRGLTEAGAEGRLAHEVSNAMSPKNAADDRAIWVAMRANFNPVYLGRGKRNTGWIVLELAHSLPTSGVEPTQSSFAVSRLAWLEGVYISYFRVRVGQEGGLNVYRQWPHGTAVPDVGPNEGDSGDITYARMLLILEDCLDEAFINRKDPHAPPGKVVYVLFKCHIDA
jgi:hypothetical protein